MANYCVTGGCGFIGSTLVHYLLAAGHHVTIIDNLSTGKKSNIPSSAHLVVTDINDTAALHSVLAHVDGCFHLAAISSIEQSSQHWVSSHQTNQTGLVRLFDIIRTVDKPIPVVFASSAAVYGDIAHQPVSETSPTQPTTAYGVDKLACEWQARVAYHTYAIPTIGLRFFNVYGPKQPYHSMYSGVITIFLAHIMKKQSLPIYGDGQAIRDFIYVNDVVKALHLAMESLENNPKKLPHLIYNVSTGKGTSIIELANKIAILCGETVKRHFLPERHASVQQSIGNSESIKKDLGFCPHVTLEAGLKMLWDYNKGISKN